VVTTNATIQNKNFDRSGSTMKHIRFEDDLLEQINAAAGKGQFSSWVKEACRKTTTGRYRAKRLNRSN
jgi:hypothetical protein